MEKKGKSEGYDIENILAIEVPEGIFIKTDNLEWCDLINSFTDSQNETGFVTSPITEQQWNYITRKYRDPLQLFGNPKLGIWKVGF
jgi:hypothetical protein